MRAWKDLFYVQHIFVVIASGDSVMVFVKFKARLVINRVEKPSLQASSLNAFVGNPRLKSLQPLISNKLAKFHADDIHQASHGRKRENKKGKIKKNKEIMRSSPNIIITGTPGVGKTTHCETLAERTGLRHVSVNQVVKDKECHEGWDEEYQSWVVDEDKASFLVCFTWKNVEC